MALQCAHNVADITERRVAKLTSYRGNLPTLFKMKLQDIAGPWEKFHFHGRTHTVDIGRRDRSPCCGKLRAEIKNLRSGLYRRSEFLREFPSWALNHGVSFLDSLIIYAPAHQSAFTYDSPFIFTSLWRRIHIVCFRKTNKQRQNMMYREGLRDATRLRWKIARRRYKSSADEA